MTIIPNMDHKCVPVRAFRVSGVRISITNTDGNRYEIVRVTERAVSSYTMHNGCVPYITQLFVYLLTCARVSCR